MDKSNTHTAAKVSLREALLEYDAVFNRMAETQMGGHSATGAQVTALETARQAVSTATLALTSYD